MLKMILLPTVIAVSAWVPSALVHPESRAHHLARAFMYDSAGRYLGSVEFEDLGGVVRLMIGLHGLPPGWHGIYIHSVGECIPPGFSSSGDHLNPRGVSHPNHAGDLSLMYVISDGTIDMRLQTDRFTLAELFDGDGSSVVVHARPDNYANIPDRYRSFAAGAPPAGPDESTSNSGDSGAPIACGVVVR